MTVYLDTAATTPVLPEVAEVVLRHMVDEFGNAGSRTHEFGTRAKRAVNAARERVAAVVGAAADDVVFTSGATEANNIALLGLVEHGLASGRRHVVTTSIEHKAVLEPVARLASLGFDVEHVPVGASGRVDADRVLDAVRADTLLVSVMAVNNETGVEQPVAEVAERLGAASEAYLHVDAAQAFGKVFEPLRHPRVDLLSVSGHKVFAPQGVGALVVRRRAYRRPPLQPLMVGGGQERGLRPGTVPVPLVAGLGHAAHLAVVERAARRAACEAQRDALFAALARVGAVVHGDRANAVPHIVNVSLPGLDAEALMVLWKDSVAVANGSACTSSSYTPSHVLTAMGLSEALVAGAVRISWSHLTPPIDWDDMFSKSRLAA